MVITLSADEARRIALAAQGFRSRTAAAGGKPIDATLNTLKVLQLDSVNVFARSHYLPVFSRHGAYNPADLDDQIWSGESFTEYWAHEAAVIAMQDRALFAWRMSDFRTRHHDTGRQQQLNHAVMWVRDRLRAEGPLLARELEPQRSTPRGAWWDWSDTKHAVEMLFAQGEVVSTGRTRFQRRYALAEQVLGEAALVSIPRADAQQQLMDRAARAYGVATLHDLADYYRLRLAEAESAIHELEERGELIPVKVEGWVNGRGSPLSAWLHPSAVTPSRMAPDALLTPFDPLVWFRPRAERIFDFHYRLEIYTPAERRVFGYYCLPLMVQGRMAGRIDVKADRRNRVLLVQAAWKERKAPARTELTAVTLLTEAARWQGLERVESRGHGNLELPQVWSAEE